MSLIFSCINSLSVFAKLAHFFTLWLQWSNSLFVVTAKYYLPGDHIMQNGEALKHFETRF